MTPAARAAIRAEWASLLTPPVRLPNNANVVRLVQCAEHVPSLCDALDAADASIAELEQTIYELNCAGVAKTNRIAELERLGDAICEVADRCIPSCDFDAAVGPIKAWYAARGPTFERGPIPRITGHVRALEEALRLADGMAEAYEGASQCDSDECCERANEYKSARAKMVKT